MSVRREAALVVAGFATLTVVLTWPQVPAIGTGVGWHYDALFSVWRIAWIAHAILHQPLHLFDANIFWPEHGTLAYSDALLLPGLLAAPALWLGVPEVVVYNLLVLLSFVACGVGMYALVRRLTGSALAGAFAGVVFAFQPNRIGHYPQLELLWGWPFPLALLALDRLFDRRRVRDGVLLGSVLVLQAWSSIYYFVFLVTIVAIVAAGMLAGRSRRDVSGAVRPLATAAIIVALLVAPYALEYASASQSVGLRRAQDVAEWSPTAASYATATPTNWLYGGRVGDGGLEKVLFPGLIAVSLALAGLVAPFDRRRLCYLAATAVAVEISLGVHGATGGWVFQHVLPYRALRVPARMFVAVSTFVAVFGGYGIARLVRGAAPWRVALGVALVAASAVESAAMPLPLMTVDTHLPGVYAWLAAQPTSPVMDWPLPTPDKLGITRTPWYMYYSTYHWQPLVAGYSGFYPVSYVRFLEDVASFPAPDALDRLHRDGVKFVILHSWPDERAYADMRDRLRSSAAFEFVRDGLSADGYVTLFRLKP